MNDEQKALQPCPLCGGHAVLDGRSDDVRVRCEGCGAFGPVSHFDADDFDAIDAAEAEAKARWNTRAALLTPQAAQPVAVDGWVLVPREPTDDMIWAGRDAWQEAHEAMRKRKECRFPMTETWAAMLAVAPTHKDTP